MGRKRKTTQQFIEDARKIHGDRYDYSKVEYIDVNTEVCIICPKHGEFWDTPARHLRGDGCPKCKFEVFGGKNKRKWTHETCYEEAKKYNNIKDFNKRSPSAYYRAKTEGWLGEYVWLAERKRERKVLPRKWTYENCYEEAKKYKQRSEFERASSGAYRVALKNGWLDDYTWFAPYMSHPAGYWTYERCYEEAKKYKTRSEFMNGSNGAYKAAVKNKWMDDFIPSVNGASRPLGYWDIYENVEREAKKYKTRTEFCRNNRSAYNGGLKNGWLDILLPRLNDSGYWDIAKNVECEAKKYKTTRQFAACCSAAYNAAVKNGWIDEYHWLERKPLQYPTGYWDVFENVKREAENYKTSHQLYRGCRGAYSAAQKHGWLDDLFPQPKTVTVYPSVSENTKHKYKQPQYPMGYWNIFDNVKCEAEKYRSRNQLHDRCRSAYNAALRNGWLDILYPLQK